MLNNKKKIKDIYDYCLKMLEDLSANIDKFDGEAEYDDKADFRFMGYYAYYIAGIGRAKTMTKVVEMFGREADGYTVEESSALIQESYARARAESELMMNAQITRDDILEKHAESLCELNSWDITDNNKKIIFSMLEKFYNYLAKI